MIIYYILITCIIIAYIVLNPYEINRVAINLDSTFNPSNNRKIYVSFCSFLLIFVAAFRSLSVGNDTYAYYLNFLKIANYSELRTAIEKVDNEKGYIVSQWIMSKIGLDFRMVIIICSILYISVIMIYIYKYSSNIAISLMIFLGLGYYTFCFTALRQSIAILICLIAFQYSLRNRPVKFALLVLLATTFHISAVLFLPSYFIGKLKLNYKTIGMFALGALIIIFNRNYLLSFLNTYSGRNYQAEATGGTMYIVFTVTCMIFGALFAYQKLKEDEINKQFYLLVVTSAILIPIATFHPALFRIYYYYSIFLIIYIPYLINQLFTIKYKTLANVAFVCLFLYLFFFDILQNSYFSNYSFMWH